MPVVIDLTGVSTEGPPPLDEGVYDAVITKADIKNSKNSGEPTLYLEFAVGDEGRNQRWSTSLQEGLRWRLKRMLVRLGIEIPDGAFEFDERELVGIECKVEIAQEPHYRDPNRMTSRIREILGPEEDGSEQSWG